MDITDIARNQNLLDNLEAMENRSTAGDFFSNPNVQALLAQLGSKAIGSIGKGKDNAEKMELLKAELELQRQKLLAQQAALANKKSGGKKSNLPLILGIVGGFLLLGTIVTVVIVKSRK